MRDPSVVAWAYVPLSARTGTRDWPTRFWPAAPLSRLPIEAMKGRKRGLGSLLLFAAVFATAASLSRAWGDQRVTPAYVSARLFKGQSMAAVLAVLPEGSPYEVHRGPLQSWKVSKSGIGDLVGTQHEIVLEFDQNNQLCSAYSEFVTGGEETTQAIPLSRTRQ